MDFQLRTRYGQNERAIVTKRKVSGGTRSADGRDCRDAFLGLMRTTAKLGVAFWIISEIDSASQASRSFPCQTSFAVADSPPEHHGSPEFCPC